MFSILEILDEMTLPVNILDIGAQNMGLGTESYNSLIKKGLCRVIGFEPVKEECEKLNNLHPDFKYLPYFIGDGTIRKFYLTNVPMTASLYEPNHPFLEKFVNLDGLCQVVKVEEVETLRLDDVREIDFSTDYIKCDVQGAELQVFENAPDILKEAVLIETEVEFVPLYKDQPLFGDVDRFLRQNGFEFHKFQALSGRSFAPLSIKDNPNRSMSQHLWSDAVYVKNFLNLGQLVEKKLLSMAVILHELYGSFDLCCYVLKSYDEKAGTDLHVRYYNKLNAASLQKAMSA